MSGIQSHPNREQMCVPLIRCIASLTKSYAERQSQIAIPFMERILLSGPIKSSGPEG